MNVSPEEYEAAKQRLRAHFEKCHQSGPYAKEWEENEWTLDGDFTLSEIVDAVLGVSHA